MRKIQSVANNWNCRPEWVGKVHLVASWNCRPEWMGKVHLVASYMQTRNGILDTRTWLPVTPVTADQTWMRKIQSVANNWNCRPEWVGKVHLVASYMQTRNGILDTRTWLPVTPVTADQTLMRKIQSVANNWNCRPEWMGKVHLVASWNCRPEWVGKVHLVASWNCRPEWMGKVHLVASYMQTRNGILDTRTWLPVTPVTADQTWMRKIQSVANNWNCRPEWMGKVHLVASYMQTRNGILDTRTWLPVTPVTADQTWMRKIQSVANNWNCRPEWVGKVHLVASWNCRPEWMGKVHLVASYMQTRNGILDTRTWLPVTPVTADQTWMRKIQSVANNWNCRPEWVGKVHLVASWNCRPEWMGKVHLVASYMQTRNGILDTRTWLPVTPVTADQTWMRKIQSVANNWNCRPEWMGKVHLVASYMQTRNGILDTRTWLPVTPVTADQTWMRKIQSVANNWNCRPEWVGKVHLVASWNCRPEWMGKVHLVASYMQTRNGILDTRTWLPVTPVTADQTWMRKIQSVANNWNCRPEWMGKVHLVASYMQTRNGILDTRTWLPVTPVTADQTWMRKIQSVANNWNCRPEWMGKVHLVASYMQTRNGILDTRTWLPVTPVTADQTWMRKIQSVANNWNCRPEWMGKVHLVASYMQTRNGILDTRTWLPVTPVTADQTWMRKIQSVANNWNCRPEWVGKVHLVASWNCRPEWMGKVQLVASYMQTRNGILDTRTWLPVTPVTADQTWMRKIQSVANNWNCRPEWMGKVQLVASYMQTRNGILDTRTWLPVTPVTADQTWMRKIQSVANNWNCRPEWMGKVHLVASYMQTRNGILDTRTWLPVTPVTADQTWMRKIQSVANNWNCRPEWMGKVHLVASYMQTRNGILDTRTWLPVTPVTADQTWMRKIQSVANNWNCRPEWVGKVHLVASWNCRPEWMGKVHLVASYMQTRNGILDTRTWLPVTPVTADQTWMRKIQSVANNWNCRPEWMGKVHLVASYMQTRNGILDTRTWLPVTPVTADQTWMRKIQSVANNWNCRPEWMGKVHLVASYMQTRNGILDTRTWLPVTPVTADQTWMRKIQSVANNWNCRPEWMGKVHLVASYMQTRNGILDTRTWLPVTPVTADQTWMRKIQSVANNWNCRPEWMGKVHLVASYMQTRNGILDTRTWLSVTPVTADQTWMRKIQSVANNWNCRPEWMGKVHLVASYMQTRNGILDTRTWLPVTPVTADQTWMRKIQSVANNWNCRPEWMGKVHLVASYMQTRNGILDTRTWLPVTPVTADQTWMRKIQSVANNWNCRPEWMGKVHLVASYMQTRNGILDTRTWLPVTPVTADQTWMRKIQSVANNWNCRPEWMGKVHLVASYMQTRNGILDTRTWLPVTPVTADQTWMRKIQSVANNWNCRPEWMGKVHLVASYMQTRNGILDTRTWLPVTPVTADQTWMRKIQSVANNWNCRPEWVGKVHLVASWNCRPEWMGKVHLVASYMQTRNGILDTRTWLPVTPVTADQTWMRKIQSVANNWNCRPEWMGKVHLVASYMQTRNGILDTRTWLPVTPVTADQTWMRKIQSVANNWNCRPEWMGKVHLVASYMQTRNGILDTRTWLPVTPVTADQTWMRKIQSVANNWNCRPEWMGKVHLVASWNCRPEWVGKVHLVASYMQTRNGILDTRTWLPVTPVTADQTWMRKIQSVANNWNCRPEWMGKVHLVASYMQTRNGILDTRTWLPVTPVTADQTWMRKIQSVANNWNCRPEWVGKVHLVASWNCRPEWMGKVHLVASYMQTRNGILDTRTWLPVTPVTADQTWMRKIQSVANNWNCRPEWVGKVHLVASWNCRPEWMGKVHLVASYMQTRNGILDTRTWLPVTPVTADQTWMRKIQSVANNWNCRPEWVGKVHLVASYMQTRNGILDTRTWLPVTPVTADQTWMRKIQSVANNWNCRPEWMGKVHLVASYMQTRNGILDTRTWLPVTPVTADQTWMRKIQSVANNCKCLLVLCKRVARLYEGWTYPEPDSWNCRPDMDGESTACS
uniref:uncharacterized protein LOC123990642 isoform X17 n=1 Tax=Oncorhynchus gorbuscha TaxID=8017 RepID=UPI001EAED97B|nr:uncharacterized protein LOC123990642 isoform X17 [Oncorhynchus gorbuscha]